MNYYLILGIALFCYMNFWFGLSLYKKRNDIADIAWGLGFVLLSWLAFLITENNSTRSFLVNILVSIWGLRLAWHIYKRNRKKTEDYRYLAWRKQWGKWFYLRSYLQVYILQGSLLFLIILPILVINKHAGPNLNFLDFFGLFVWLVGFLFEAISDYQLQSFINKAENKGKLMQSGLWSYSRHPNYFGEVVQWWGIWLIAINMPLAWLTIIGPITITILIVKISGIPLLEKKMEKHPDFLDYQKRTSSFIPNLPKKV